MSRLRLLLLPLVVLMLASCSRVAGTQGGAYVTGDGQISVWAADKRGEPVHLTGDTLDGGTWSSQDALGKPVVVNVWWSQCGPCRKEMPMLQSAAAEFAGKVTFVGVNTRDNSADNGLAFERSIGVSYPSIYSPDGQALLALPGLPASAMPATVILDAEGRIAASVPGQLPSKLTLTQLVQCVVDGAARDKCTVSGKSS